MRIAFLCKRFYMGKDVIQDRYARLYEIPRQLAQLGHDVRGYCLSYQGHEEGRWIHEAAGGRLEWVSRSFGRNPLKLGAYPFALKRDLRSFVPDLLIGASDIPHVALAGWLSRRLGVPYAVDLYDNFEGFGQAKLPGMVGALRKATRNATVVLTTSEALKALVVDSYHAHGHVVAMPSTIDGKVFYRKSQADARRALKLPEDAILIGTAGGLYLDKGIGTLYDAWHQLARDYPRAHLVLAGPHAPQAPPPSGTRVLYLGQLAHAKTADLFNALDLGVIYLRDTVFGRYCFPQKAYEMLACGLPIVSARVGAMTGLLGESDPGLYQADNAEDLVRAIKERLDGQRNSPPPIKDWEGLIRDVEPLLRTAARNPSSSSL